MIKRAMVLAGFGLAVAGADHATGIHPLFTFGLQ
jgi:hypothetical protein